MLHNMISALTFRFASHRACILAVAPDKLGELEMSGPLVLDAPIKNKFQDEAFI